jgi:hypothetical protein
VVHGQGLGGLKEADQLEPVQSLGAGLIGVHLRKAGVDGGVGGDQAIDVRNRKHPRTPCIIVLTEESRSPLSWRWRM